MPPNRKRNMALDTSRAVRFSICNACLSYITLRNLAEIWHSEIAIFVYIVPRTSLLGKLPSITTRRIELAHSETGRVIAAQWIALRTMVR